MSARSAPSTVNSSVNVDASSVYRLLVEEHQAALASARSVLRRMRKHAAVRDMDALLKLESSFALVRASASYLGLSLLREVAYEAERVIERLKLPTSKQNTQALDALREAFELVETALLHARDDQRTSDYEERGVRVRELLRACHLAPSVQPDQMSEQELFVEDAQRHVELCREALVRAADDSEAGNEAIQAAFRAMHTLKGNAGMMGFAEIEALGRAAEQTLEGLRGGELALTANLTLALLGLLEKASVAIKRPHAFHWHREAQAIDVACAEARIVARRTRLGALLVEHHLVSNEQVELVLAIKREPLGQALILLNALGERELQQALSLQRKLRAGEEASEVIEAPPSAGNVLVDKRKLDRLMHEIARVSSAAGAASGALTQALDELREAAATLARIPLRCTMRRAALGMRELAERQSKRLAITVHGEELEVDRDVATCVHDALLHLGRNAVDHGLEHPIERVSAGKGEVGNIAITARLSASVLVVELIDDGRGLDRRAIIEQAVRRGLLDAARAADVADDALFSLLLRPGFSTARQVTDISGRGVGLDAVRCTIEALGGGVSLQPEAGGGTRVTLRLPQRSSRSSAL